MEELVVHHNPDFYSLGLLSSVPFVRFLTNQLSDGLRTLSLPKRDDLQWQEWFGGVARIKGPFGVFFQPT